MRLAHDRDAAGARGVVRRARVLTAFARRALNRPAEARKPVRATERAAFDVRAVG